MTYGTLGATQPPLTRKEGAADVGPGSVNPFQNQAPHTLEYYCSLSEEQIQRAVIQHLDRRGIKDGNGRKVLYWHPKNGGVHQATARQRMINAQQGVLPGIPDIQLYYGGQLYCLELKSLKGKLTPEQQLLGHLFREQGAITGVAFGLIEALAWLERHNLLVGRTV